MPPAPKTKTSAAAPKKKLTKAAAAKAKAIEEMPVDAAPAGGPLPSTFKRAQAKKAVDALLTHAAKVAAEREDTELIARDEYVWLSINTKTGSTRKKLMPVKIQLPNPALPPPPATSVCLFVKDPQREYKDLLASSGIKFINRVVGVEKLRGKFKPFEARRQLRNEHELFLCDDRVLPMMPKLLGKMFFEVKKQPIPVNLQRKDLKAELGRAISSTYFHPSTGTSNSIRIATPGVTTPEQTLNNLLAAVPAAVNLIPGGWDNILSVGIKTSSSVLLPVWNAKLDDRFASASTDASAPAEAEVEIEAEEPVEEKPAKKTKTPVAAVEKLKKTAAAKASAAAVGASENGTPKKKSSTIGSGAKKGKVAAVGSGAKRTRK